MPSNTHRTVKLCRDCSVLVFAINMDKDAVAYSEVNGPQYKSGCRFARSLKISEGSKVLDMGCGTGDVTAFIAKVVGAQGEVIGVDPSQDRIKIAQERYRNVPNLHFMTGTCRSKLPHEDDEYYDLHFSSNSFQWLIGDEKQEYLGKAYKSLRKGGRLGFLTAVKSEKFSPNESGIAVEVLYESEYKKLCVENSFTNIATEMAPFVARFSNREEYVTWFRATTHKNPEELDETWIKSLQDKGVVRIEDDGSIAVDAVDLLGLRAEKH